jgi:UDP-N-acetylmuramate dehydrogenase
MEILKDISLKEYSSYKIGGLARFFCIAENKEDIISAINFAKDNNLEILPIGGGSNILFSDKGFDGLVLKIKNNDIEILEEGDKVLLMVSSGILLSQLLDFSKQNSLAGLEWMAGIPGTLGGAIVGNAGIKNGQNISDCIRKIFVFDIKDKELKIFNKDDCNFKYRESIFKGNNDYVLINAEIALNKGIKENIESLSKEILQNRIATQPYNLPSVGSVFKNPENDSAGRLIEACGLKGKQIGGAKISELHANFIVNVDNASSNDVMELIDLIKKTVKEKFNILLEEEIEFF